MIYQYSKEIFKKLKINTEKVVIDIEKPAVDETSKKEKKVKYDRKRKTISDTLSVGGK